MESFYICVNVKVVLLFIAFFAVALLAIGFDSPESLIYLPVHRNAFTH